MSFNEILKLMLSAAGLGAASLASDSEQHPLYITFDIMTNRIPYSTGIYSRIDRIFCRLQTVYLGTIGLLLCHSVNVKGI